MAIAESYSGTQAATLTIEHVLNTTTPETTDGIYQLFINVSAMTSTDDLTIKVKEKVVSTGTQSVVLQEKLLGAQSIHYGI